MSKFVIKGTDDAARAQLQKNLDAQNAAFKASFDAVFKAASSHKETPAAKSTATLSQRAGGPGTLLGTSRGRKI